MKIQFPSLDDPSVSEIIRNALVVIVLVVVVDVVVVLWAWNKQYEAEEPSFITVMMGLITNGTLVLQFT